MKRMKILGVLLILGLVFLTGCDLTQNESNKQVTKNKEVKKVEKKDITDTELAKKLHSQLVSNDKEIGSYFNNKVSTSETSAELIRVSIKKYLEDNNIDLESIVPTSSTFNAGGGDLYKIKKSDLSSFMNKNYNTTINYDISNSNKDWSTYLDDDTVIHSINDDWLLTSRGEGKNHLKIYSEIIKATEEKNKIEIFDKAIIGSEKIDTFGVFYKSISDIDEELREGNFPQKVLYYCTSDNKGSSHICNEDDKLEKIFEKYNNELNTYKHTFEKGKDGEYYWVSSEIEK